MEAAQIVNVWSIYFNLPFRAETSWLSTVRDEARGASSIHSSGSSRARCLNSTLCIWYDLLLYAYSFTCFRTEKRYFSRRFKEFLLIFSLLFALHGVTLPLALFIFVREYNLRSELQICCMYCLDRREFGNWDQAKRSRHVENFFFLCLSFNLSLCAPFFLARRSRVSLFLFLYRSVLLRLSRYVSLLFTFFSPLIMLPKYADR